MRRWVRAEIPRLRCGRCTRTFAVGDPMCLVGQAELRRCEDCAGPALTCRRYTCRREIPTRSNPPCHDVGILRCPPMGRRPRPGSRGMGRSLTSLTGLSPPTLLRRYGAAGCRGILSLS